MAAPILSYEDLGLIQGEGWLFRELDIYVGERDRLALIGRNGAGKTTLLKLLTGEMQPDSGTVTRAKTLSGIVIDQQRKLMEPDKRVKDVLATAGDWIDVRGHKKHIKGYLCLLYT